MSNLDIIQKLTVGKDDVTEVNIEYDGTEYPFTIRPLTSGEISKLEGLEKKSLVFKTGVKNGRRQTINTKNDVDVNAGRFTEDRITAMYQAIALSLSVGDEKVTVDDVKGLKPGLPERLFDHVITISKLNESDLLFIKKFRKDE